MTHLYIELNNIPEVVTSNVIHKLYETAKAIIDAEEANDVQESLVSLKGNLLVSKAYGDEIDWLEAKFPDLHITASDRYIRFADPEVERICVNVLNWGDGTGCTEDDLYAINTVSGSVFGGNKSITTFNELRYFKPTAFNQVGLLGGCSSLTEVTLPSGTTVIGQDMFANCSNLTTIRNTESITEIKGLANCSKLVSINTPNLISVRNWGCSGCTLLSTIDTSNVTSIGRNAFLNCTSLTSVDLSNCTSIGESSFLNCTSLVISNLNVPNLTALGVAAFSGTKIGQISNLGTITKIDIEVFKDCTTLTSVVLPSTVTELCLRSFSGCSLLSTINLDNIESVTGYGGMQDSYTFNGCSSLTNVSLPKCTTLSLYGTFDGCTNLKILVAPNVTDVGRGSGSFYNCSHLKGIFFPKLSFNNMTGSNYWAPGFFSDGMSSLVIIDMGNVGMMSKYTVSRFPALRAFVIRNTTTIPTLDDSTDSAFSNVTFFVDDNLLSTYQLDSNWANVQLDVISHLNLSNYLDSDLLQIYNSCITASLSQN